MKKDYLYILGIVVVASILTVYLFSLPKEVLKEKNRQLESASDMEATKETEPSSNHFALTAKQEDKIKKLRTSLVTFSEKEKKLIFADSLVQAYLEVAHLDSALYYIDIYESLASSIDDKQKAADFYYKAYGLEQRKALQKSYSAKAVVLYREIVDSEPNLAAKTRLGVLLTQASNNPMEGILLLRQVLEENPNYIEALFSLGEFSMFTQQYDKAIHRFESILKIQPDHIESLIYLGDSQAATGNKKAAVSAYNKAKLLTEGDKFFEQLLNQKLKEVN